jgi:gentisate 1,2-dioxygenase
MVLGIIHPKSSGISQFWAWKTVLAHILSIDLEYKISGENEVRTSLALNNPSCFHRFKNTKVD